MKTQNRPLTQEELDLTPEWATHYLVDKCGDICFESNYHKEWLMAGELSGVMVNFEISANSSLINPEPFDIESVEWSDRDIESVQIDICGNIETIFKDGSYMDETKQDIINKAKALGVTPEDLK